MLRAALALVLLVAALPATAQVEPGTYRLVAGRSAAHIAVASPVGTAHLALPAEGEVTVGAGGRVTGGRMTLDVRAMRAEGLVATLMKGPEGFDTARHPRASVTIEGGTIAGGAITLEGRLTMRGRVNTVRLSGEVLREQGRRLSAELAGRIDRTAWGIVAGRPLYSRQADVRFRLVASR